jgi:hypothetical protein
VTALWLEAGVVKSAVMLFGSSWGSATQVSDTGASGPAIGIDSATGNVVAAWARSGYIESSTKLFESTWGQVSVLSNVNSDSPQVAAGNGLVVAVWHTATSADTIVAASAVIGGAWNSAQTISPPTLNHVFPEVAVDINGNAHVVWFQYNLVGLNYTDVNVLGVSLNAGSDIWGPLAVISNPGSQNPALLSLRIGCDSNGNATAVWTNVYFDDLFAVESAVLPLGGTWGLTVALTANDLYAYTTDVAVNSYGDAVIFYMTYDGVSSVNIDTAESNISGVEMNAWSIPLTVSQGTGNGFPRVATMLSGTTVNAAAVWITNNGTYNTIQAITGSKTILLPPSDPTVTQGVNDFGVFQEYYNNVNWQGSPDPNAVAYNIYRNGIFYNRVDISVTQFIDDNQVENGTVVYGIAAEDSDHAQSTIATVTFP